MDLVQYGEKLKKALDFFVDEIRTLRTGRATPALVENLRVDYYGNPTPLKQVASISVPEARLIMIKPYDKSLLSAVEKVISESDLGVQATNDGNILRISLPPLNEERREEFAKIVREKAEEAKVSMRNARREAVDEIVSKEKSGEVSEDEKHRQEKEIQDKLDEHIKTIDQKAEEKEKEIKEI